MKQALLAAGFGTTVPHAAQELAALEAALAAAAPGWTMARAYTSGMVRRILAGRGQPVDSVAGALSRLKAAGVEEVFVQPTHFLCGVEYDKLKAEAGAMASGFARLRVGRPLLDGTAAVRQLAGILAGLYPAQEGQAVVLMGHGTTAGANLVYPAMQAVFDLAGRPDILAEVCGQLASRPGVSRVKLAPLMLAAGDHVLNDMAGDGSDSWKNVLAAEGYQVECVLHGLAAEQAVRQMYADRLREELVD